MSVCADQPEEYEGNVYPANRPHMEYVEGAPYYRYQPPGRELNKFELERGQWTDDCSMALCLADSLLCREGYHGGDARVRWHSWWYYGYNNAFRHAPADYDDDGKRVCSRQSVGLGGNIAQSLDEVDELGTGTAAEDVPSHYSSRNEDAGNGSIMRLAPVPVYYRRDVATAMQVGEDQSRATHPGTDAAACCRFLTYFIVRAINRRGTPPGAADVTASGFLEETVAAFQQAIAGTPEAETDGMKRLLALLRADPPFLTECNWDWKAATPEIRNAIINRRNSSPDGTYNGYPVIPTYWGAYCMDGLAIALWGLHRSSSFAECIQRVVNLHGDADTTAAIAGQMAGAFYGYEAIVASPQGREFVADVRKWDPYAEIGLRAAMLYHCGAGAEQ
eukprot:TRINITY_DN1557_c0_g2_i1.p2 TRINITY_DN1557_c0_g2~~TRINITY_DN1557_c0_g2_i1.p2  ORF type:complete len:390 (+),score=109.08 TRINITY_DN1557_c0_g2_i1:65-1234(+)